MYINTSLISNQETQTTLTLMDDPHTILTLSERSEQLTEITKIITFKKLVTKQNRFDTITTTVIDTVYELNVRLKFPSERRTNNAMKQ